MRRIPFLIWAPLAMVFAGLFLWYGVILNPTGSSAVAKASVADAFRPRNKAIAVRLPNGSSYINTKKEIQLQRQSLRKAWQQSEITYEAARKQAITIFTRLLTDSLYPHWKGTPWDFNGTTETPREGTIACGYFVTTLLRDMGVSINRVKMAQCVSSQMINSLAAKKFIRRYDTLTYDDFVTKMRQQPAGISIIGLDFHTGFLYHDGENCWFIHSNYIGKEGVIMESAAFSAALKASKTRMVGFVTQDENFMGKWIK
jgi:hypothetical protein